MKEKTETVEVNFDNKIENLHAALLKKALGYRVKESTCEYAVVDGEIKLIKKKVSVKVFPPDLTAIEIILYKNKLPEVENLTDEELEEEKQKLIKQLNLIKATEKETKKNNQKVKNTNLKLE